MLLPYKLKELGRRDGEWHVEAYVWTPKEGCQYRTFSEQHAEEARELADKWINSKLKEKE